MPEVKLVQQVGIDVQEVERCWIRQADDLHVTEKQKEIVQLIGLKAQLAFIATIRHAVQKIPNVLTQAHRVIVSGARRHMFSQYDNFTRNTLWAGALKTPPKSRPNRKSPWSPSPDRPCCQTTKSEEPGLYSQRSTLVVRNDR